MQENGKMKVRTDRFAEAAFLGLLFIQVGGGCLF